MNEYYKAYVEAEKDDRRWRDHRSRLVTKYSWAIPSDDAIRVLAKHSPIVEVGAGAGYWAKLTAEAGGNVRAFDSSPAWLGRNGYVDPESRWFPVQRAQANVTARFPHRTLFLCWPPYNTGMAEEALRAYRGNTVVYVGESVGGCTATDAFHEQLDESFNEVDRVDIPRWFGIHDRMTVWRRK